MGRIVLIVVFALVLAAGAATLWLSSTDSNQGQSAAALGTTMDTRGSTPAEPELSAAGHDPKVNDGQLVAASERESRPAPSPASDIASPRSLIERIALQPDLALTQTTLAETWTVSDYQSASANSQTIDGATAFAAYEFARSCIGQPRSDQQFEFRLEQYSQYSQDNPRRISSDRLDRAMDGLQEDFLRCEPFAETDLVDAASSWLMLSADLDYLPAQVRFYQELPALLRQTQSRVFREPHYLDLHREKSTEYLNRALLTGHPRAFLAMAIALSDGVIFNQDLIASHAYLLAANLAAAGRDLQIGEMLDRSQTQLSPGDLRLAEGWGTNLCWDYCQLGEAVPLP